jgi:hypothetical protein
MRRQQRLSEVTSQFYKDYSLIGIALAGLTLAEGDNEGIYAEY